MESSYHCPQHGDKSWEEIKNAKKVDCVICYNHRQRVTAQEERKRKKEEKEKAEKAITELTCDDCEQTLPINQFACKKIIKRCNNCQGVYDKERHKIYNKQRDKMVKEENNNPSNQNKSIKCNHCHKWYPPTDYIGTKGTTQRCKVCRNKQSINDRSLPIEKKREKNVKAYYKHVTNIKKIEETCDNKNEKLCHDKLCKFKGQKQPIENFIDDEGNSYVNCNNCRVRQRIYDQARNIRDKLSGKFKEKHKKRWTAFNKMIKELEEENTDPNYKICRNRDCDERRVHISEFIGPNDEETSHCNSCREVNTQYTKEYREIHKNDPEYLEKKRQEHKNWVSRNPHLVTQINRRRRINASARVKNIIRKAEERKISFSLEFKHAMELTLGNCYYCNQSPDDEYINGIDRLDNNQGYNINNVVTCCRDCNFAKGIANLETFVLRARHIVRNLYPEDFPENWYYPEVFHNDLNKSGKFIPYSQSYQCLLYRAEKKGFINVLTEKQHDEMIKQPCNYCGQKEFINHNFIHIDRIASDGEYNIENCVPCCSCCNFMKNDMEINIFLQKLKNIAEKFDIKDEEIVVIE